MRGNLGHQLSPNTHRTTLMSDADYREVRGIWYGLHPT
jgi:hypothetical protein